MCPFMSTSAKKKESSEKWSKSKFFLFRSSFSFTSTTFESELKINRPFHITMRKFNWQLHYADVGNRLCEDWFAIKVRPPLLVCHSFNQKCLFHSLKWRSWWTFWLQLLSPKQPFISFDFYKLFRSFVFWFYLLFGPLIFVGFPFLCAFHL